MKDADTNLADAFVCIECGRGVIRLTEAGPPDKLCAACLMLPGWFRDPGLRAVIDPHHDGREAALTCEALP